MVSKWFGIDLSCATCEVLREQLINSERERRELLTKLLDKGNPEPLNVEHERPIPITPQFIPWRVKQQMLEAEDRQKSKLMKDKEKEIAELEKELEIK